MNYKADGYEGYVADVTYEGTAAYPTDAAPAYHAAPPIPTTSSHILTFMREIFSLDTFKHYIQTRLQEYSSQKTRTSYQIQALKCLTESSGYQCQAYKRERERVDGSCKVTLGELTVTPQSQTGSEVNVL